MIESLLYIIRFLVGDDVSPHIAKTIGYTADRKLFPQYTIVIIPSGFFDDSTYGKPSSLPTLPLQEIDGVPLLFGSPEIEKEGDTWIIHADIIASTYFLITRYEEIVRREVRDEHGRFLGTESLPFRGWTLIRPVVDEYRLLLRKWLQQAGLQVPDIKQEIRHIYLTHDVDAPFLYRSWKGAIRSLQRGRGWRQTFRSVFGPPEADFYYKFPYIFQQNNMLRQELGAERCRSLLFFKAGGNCKEDKPRYNLRSKDMQTLLREAAAHQAEIGLHSSYQAGMDPSLIAKEKAKLDKICGQDTIYNRHHFLACREPEDMDQLEAAGITDDFTLGYADHAGFRLGTSYPVRWINPVTRRLSSLTLHPLLVMDSTLSERKYMGLNALIAEQLCICLFRETKRVGGDLNILWHNTSFSIYNPSYLSRLYPFLLNELAQK